MQKNLLLKLNQLQRLQVKVRKLVDSRFVGEYRSAYRGSGIEFDEIREYQIGDEIRAINWNVTAKSADKVFVNVFREERELNLFVLFDISGSEYFGKIEQSKITIGTEITAILAFSAMQNNDKFGLITYSDQAEKVFKLGKGRKHILSVISYLVNQQPQSRGTHLMPALEYFHRIQKKHAVLIIISDFLDTHNDYFEKIKFLKKKHDITFVRLFHPDETLQNVVGIFPTIDSETGACSWINNHQLFSQSISEHFEQVHKQLHSFCHEEKIDYLTIRTTEDYVPILEKYFKSHHKLSNQ